MKSAPCGFSRRYPFVTAFVFNLYAEALDSQKKHSKKFCLPSFVKFRYFRGHTFVFFVAFCSKNRRDFSLRACCGQATDRHPELFPMFSALSAHGCKNTWCLQGVTSGITASRSPDDGMPTGSVLAYLFEIQSGRPQGRAPAA